VLDNYERGIIVEEDWSNRRHAIDSFDFSAEIERIRQRNTQRRLEEARRALEEAKARTEQARARTAEARARTRAYEDITNGLRERRERTVQLSSMPSGPEKDGMMAEIQQEIDALWQKYEVLNARGRAYLPLRRP
jgi:multidrug resistance efflux pump